MSIFEDNVTLMHNSLFPVAMLWQMMKSIINQLSQITGSTGCPKNIFVRAVQLQYDD